MWAALSAIALVAATAVTTVGATLGLTYLRVQGWTAGTLLGLAVLVAGATSLLVLAVHLVRNGRGWWRLLAVPVALALLLFVVYPVLTATYATQQPTAVLGAATPADRGLEYADATFTTADGVELSGWYLPSTNGAAVALLHGSSSTRSAVLAQAEVLNRHGYGVLLFDARGHGRSGGDPMDLGWYGEPDTMAAVDHLTTRPDVDPDKIAVVGLSMGGEEAIGAMAADGRIRAVVAEGASNRTFEDKDDWLPGGVGGWVQRQMDRLAYTLTDLATPASPPISLRRAAAEAAPRPILLIAGSGEEEAARSIQRGAPDSVSIWESGTEHTRGLATHPEEWTSRVTEFLDAALGL